MDWATIIISLGGALLTGGGALSLLYYKENRRAKQIDNEKSIIEEWQGVANDIIEKELFDISTDA